MFDFFKDVLPHCRVRVAEPGQPVSRIGEPIHSVFAVVEGLVAVRHESETVDVLLGTYETGSLVGVEGLFEPPGECVVVRALSTCRLAEISHRKLNFMLDNEMASAKAEAYTQFARQLANTVTKQNARTVRQSTQLASDRVLFALQDLARTKGTREGDFTRVKTNRQELATLSGCVREVVSRNLAKLKSAGLINADGRDILVPVKETQ